MSLQSLRTGVSGLKANQTRLNVVSNNISNSSTTAFKRGRAAFSEVLGQEVFGAGKGATPSKVGRGATVASVDRTFAQGSLDETGIKTDLSLDGDGFFIASPEEGVSSQERKLTRAGDFTFDQNGELVTNGGLNVKGWEVNEAGDVQTGALQDIKLDPNAQSSAKFTSDAEVGGNISADAAVGDTNSISSVVYDEQGTAHNAVVDFEKTGDNQWDYTVSAADGAPFQDGNGGDDGVASGQITFKSDGSMEEITDSGGTPLTGPDGNPSGPSIDWKNDLVAGGQSLSIELGQLTQYSGSTTSKFQSQNGHSSGELAGFGITSKGELQLSYTNGVQEKTHQLAIGNVNNPNGLEQQGDNFYTTTSESGDLQLGRAGRDLKTAVVSGSLESSNVDLATEFANLIEAQRSYQASSRVVTTADQVLQETVQLKR